MSNFPVHLMLLLSFHQKFHPEIILRRQVSKTEYFENSTCGKLIEYKERNMNEWPKISIEPLSYSRMKKTFSSIYYWSFKFESTSINFVFNPKAYKIRDLTVHFIYHKYLPSKNNLLNKFMMLKSTLNESTFDKGFKKDLISTWNYSHFIFL